jgi:hypothetical protein
MQVVAKEKIKQQTTYQQPGQYSGQDGYTPPFGE